MTRYRGFGVSWRGHRYVVSLVVSKIRENVQNDPLWKKAYEELSGFQPVSPVDDEGWLDFYGLLERRVKELKGERVVSR